MGKLRVGLFFGGRSTEHEISVISALQAYRNLDKEKYEVIPVYVSKAGRFYSDPRFLELKNYKDIDELLLSSTKITQGTKELACGFYTQGLLPKFTQLDIIFPIFHGAFGEDGSIQGLFEIYQVPYVGFNVMSSAVAMDKVISKALFKELGFNVAGYVVIKRTDWIKDQNQELEKVKKALKFPMFVKPATAGSSIGANKTADFEKLEFNIDVAFTYSDKVIVEECLENVIEVNCSVLGYGTEFQASVCEMPLASGELLSFDDKYRKGGKGSKGSGMASLSRVIPAPISDKLAREIQEISIKIFKALDGCGVARIDYFVESKAVRSSRSPRRPQDDTACRIWVNEVNSPPGSLSFYLWEPTGLKFKDLLDKLIEYGLKRAEDQQKTQYVFNSGLLSQMAIQGGIKR